MYDPIEAAHAAPSGPQVAAVFDLDNTILSGWSVLPFARDIAMTRLIAPSARRRNFGAVLLLVLAADRSADASARQFELLLGVGARSLRGRRVQWLVELGERIHERELSDLVFPEMRDLVEAHAERGHTLVLASAATPFQADPVARELGIEHVVCSQLATRFGRFTGELEGRPCFGPEKRDRVLDLLDGMAAETRHSFFYSDGWEDVPLLEIVGHPVVVNPGERLEERAGEDGWPVLRLESVGSAGLGEHLQRMLTLEPTVAFDSWFARWGAG
jgi:putative phosphoserine phosphatase/1-acylglycerol-3-phosphate O-acyltransferase